MANTLELGNGKWATGKDTVLAFNDENNNFKPLPFDFTRASSATVVNKAGLIETVGSGEPRIDFSNDAKGALKLEPQSNNLVTYSEDFSNAAWTGGGSITISGGYLAPDGSDNAYKVSGSGGALNGGFGLIESTTRSIYARTVSGAGKISLLSYFGNSNNLFDITEEWQRFEVSTSISTGSNSFYAVDFRSLSATLSEVIIWGANATNDQSYATSYIPTQGSAVTRVADASSQTVPSGIIGQTEGGVIYMDFIAQNTGATAQSHFFLGSAGSEIGLYGGNQLIFYSSGGVSISGGNIVTGQRYKVAFAYETNDYAAYVNGVQVGVDTSATYPTMSSIFLNSYSNGTEIQKKEIKDFKLYNTRLSNAELQALTTL
jgi:hypothetical protein